MAKESPPTAGQLIRNMMLVLTGGAVCAIVFGLLTIWAFSPSGSYKVEKILLSPSVMAALSYPDVNASTGKTEKYVFERLELLYFDGGWKKQNVPLEHYVPFYDLISDDVSIPKDVEPFFQWSNPAYLSIIVKNEQGDTKVFQEVQFAQEGQYYRVQLRDRDISMNWAYFLREGIYEKVVKMMGQQ